MHILLGEHEEEIPGKIRNKRSLKYNIQQCQILVITELHPLLFQIGPETTTNSVVETALVLWCIQIIRVKHAFERCNMCARNRSRWAQICFSELIKQESTAKVHH